MVLLSADVLIIGDFNFRVDDAMHEDAKEFLTLLDNFNLSQHIVEPTHKYGLTLDFIISKQGASLIKNVNVFLPWISDHSVVRANIMTTKPRFLMKNVTFRKWKHKDMDQYRHDLANDHFELNNPILGVDSSNLLINESDDDLTRATTPSFFPITEQDVEKIIKKTNNKFSSHYSLPPWLLRQHLSILLVLLMLLICPLVSLSCLLFLKRLF